MISPASLCEIKDRIHANEESEWKMEKVLKIIEKCKDSKQLFSIKKCNLVVLFVIKEIKEHN
jgi:hypothetical protein